MISLAEHVSQNHETLLPAAHPSPHTRHTSASLTCSAALNENVKASCLPDAGMVPMLAVDERVLCGAASCAGREDDSRFLRGICRKMNRGRRLEARQGRSRRALEGPPFPFFRLRTASRL